MFFRKKPVAPLTIPDPGQQVYLLPRLGAERGRWRAISEPFTNPRGEVVIRVAAEWECQVALREGRRAVGIPWPVKQMEVIFPSETLDAPETASEEPAGASAGTSEGEPETESSRPSWWRRWFGG